jgi:hypothetical protein
LHDRLCRGASVETSNQYLTHLKVFGHWLVKDVRAAVSPFVHLEASNAQIDRRHDRRELEAAELQRLLEVSSSRSRSRLASARQSRSCAGVIRQAAISALEARQVSPKCRLGEPAFTAAAFIAVALIGTVLSSVGRILL